MSTRAYIAKEAPDGSCKAIYSHWDGYPSHLGKVLFEHYRDEAKVEALFALGDISVIGREPVDSPEMWMSTEKMSELFDAGYTMTYRSRGEECPATSFADRTELDDYLEKTAAEYLYVYGADGNWYAEPVSPYSYHELPDGRTELASLF